MSNGSSPSWDLLEPCKVISKPSFDYGLFRCYKKTIPATWLGSRCSQAEWLALVKSKNGRKTSRCRVIQCRWKHSSVHASLHHELWVMKNFRIVPVNVMAFIMEPWPPCWTLFKLVTANPHTGPAALQRGSIMNGTEVPAMYVKSWKLQKFWAQFSTRTYGNFF